MPVTYNTRGTIVFEEGKSADYVAFVLSGEFELVKLKITEEDSELFEFIDE